MLARKNARNIVVVTRWLVFKLPRDLNLHRVFKEFLLTLKAFLHGLAPPAIMVGPLLIRAYVKLLKDVGYNTKDIKEIEGAIQKLAALGIEHRELRHPERHVGLWRGHWVFIDFDHGRISRYSRDINKFRAWATRRVTSQRR